MGNPSWFCPSKRAERAVRVGRIDMRRVIRLAVLASALFTALPTPAQEAPGAGRDGTVPVGTIVALRRPVTEAKDFVGRIEAINRVDIRARVTSFLDDVLFREGDVIKTGAALYRIEAAPFQTAVQKAEGALYRTQAIYANAAQGAGAESPKR
jgi:membrane fusion protein, multidrug efflux system